MSAPGIETAQLGDLPVRIARPAEKASTAVVVLHQAAGWSPQTAQWLQTLAGEGHLAIAPMLLHRAGVESIDPGERFGADLEAFARFLPGDADLRTDLAATLDYLRSAGVAPTATGVLGFSYGGRAAYLAAAEHALGGAVGWYAVGVQRAVYHGNDGLPGLADRTAKLQTPWLGLLGELDFLQQPGELDDWAAALPGAPVPAHLVRYPEAGHAFDVQLPEGVPAPPGLVFDAGAAADAARRTLEFFRKQLR